MNAESDVFLGWFDDTRGKTVADKIREAVERYAAKFGTDPNLVLVSPADSTPVEGLHIKPVEYVRPNYFWVGVEAQGETAGSIEPAQPVAA